jgi:ceramide glucosyltransferase
VSGVIAAIGWAVFALAVVGCLYQLAATALTVRFLRRGPPPAAALPPVTLIKPLHGAYADMAAVLEGYCDQDYPAPVQILFGVHDEADDAVAVARALIARRPDADIELVVDGASHGVNGKVSNLVNIAARARHETLVISDADIAVAPDYLRRVVSALAGKGVGAVSCLYAGRAGAGVWSSLGAMAISYGFLPNAALGMTLGLAKPCFGSTIAITAATLADIGGLAAFANRLADDYEIGRAVRARGLTVAVPPMVVSHLCLDASATALIAQELRWGRTILQIDPAGYLGSLITYPLALALIAAALLGFAPPSVALIFIVLGVRVAAKLAMDRATGASAGPLGMIPVRDVLSFGVFVASFAVRAVGWRGRRYRVGRDGVLSHP